MQPALRPGAGTVSGILSAPPQGRSCFGGLPVEVGGLDGVDPQGNMEAGTLCEQGGWRVIVPPAASVQLPRLGSGREMSLPALLSRDKPPEGPRPSGTCSRVSQ